MRDEGTQDLHHGGDEVAGQRFQALAVQQLPARVQYENAPPMLPYIRGDAVEPPGETFRTRRAAHAGCSRAQKCVMREPRISTMGAIRSSSRYSSA